MAESESGQDKTEEPTEKRRREAREKGQLPRSRELNTLAILMAGAGGLLIYGADLAGALLRLMRSNFELSRETAMNTESMLQLLGASAYLAAQGLWPILLMLLVAAIVGPIALGGWLFSMDALQPKFSRLNPLSGLKRMFSAKSLLELSKALIKFLVVLAVALLVLSADRDALLALAHQPLEQAILHSVRVVGWSAFWMACSLLLIAAVDVPYQIWDNRQKLLMTKQEVRDEYKDSGGQARGQVEDPPDAARDGAETDDGGGAGGRRGDHQPDPLRRSPEVRPGGRRRRCCWPRATISWP